MSEGAPKSVKQTGEESTKIIEIFGSELEVGPSLGDLKWIEIDGELSKLNEKLKQGEKQWRLLTKEECLELGKEITRIEDDESISNSEAIGKIDEYIKNLGLETRYYWTGSEDVDNTNQAWNWSTADGSVVSYNKSRQMVVQCFR